MAEPNGLSAAMVEATARALHERDRRQTIGEPAWEGLEAEDREEYRNAMRAVLAAALAVCEVRVEEGLRLTWVETGKRAPDDHWDGDFPGWARNAVAEHAAEIAADPGWRVRPTLLRHLIITTPAEETTER